MTVDQIERCIREWQVGNPHLADHWNQMVDHYARVYCLEDWQVTELSSRLTKG